MLCCLMLELAEIDHIAGEATRRVVGGAALASVHAEPILASDGKDALRILVVFSRDLNPAAEGDIGLNTIIGVRDALVRAGEERFPIIDFSTEYEEALGVDPQS